MTELIVSDIGAPGFVRDSAAYTVTPQAFDEVRNVRFGPTGAQTFAGEASVFSPAPFSPLWLGVFPPVATPIWVYAGLDKVGAFDGAHYDLTRASGPYAGDVAERWQGGVLNGVGIFNNVRDVPQQWIDFDVSQKLQDLQTWPATLRVKSLRSFGNFLMALHTIENGVAKPYRMRWSNAAFTGEIPNGWALNDPTSYAGEKDIAESEDYLVDGLKLGQQFIMYKQRSVYAAWFIDRPDVFAHRRLFADKGLLWRDCAHEFPGGHFAAGIDDLYLHTGAENSAQSICDAQLRRWIFNQIDSNNYFNCYSFNYASRNESWFCFPEAGETYPTLAAVYNRKKGGIGIRDLRKCPYIAVGPIVANPEGRIWGVGLVNPPVLAGETDNSTNSLSWTVPTVVDATIIGYTLFRRVNAGSWTQVYTGSATNFEDEDIDSGNSYDYYVQALTDNAGTSDNSNIVTLAVAAAIDMTFISRTAGDGRGYIGLLHGSNPNLLFMSDFFDDIADSIDVVTIGSNFFAIILRNVIGTIPQNWFTSATNLETGHVFNTSGTSDFFQSGDEVFWYWTDVFPNFVNGNTYNFRFA